jgi:hypothetical protein
MPGPNAASLKLLTWPPDIKTLSLCPDALRMKPEDISAADLADLR